MKTIWKFELSPHIDEFEAPDNAQVLSVHTQHGNPCLWMLVDTNIPTRTYGIRIFGTGHNANEIDDNWEFAGTVLLENDFLVFHVFVS